MTAQNMGKKILSDAGYDVVAVSNGAAAVKKIAEQKPDIIILDVYMPGYSGLEVCEKVRGSLDTLKTPVLLTVGKLEPFKSEDGNRVKADGVIIKPFEASDLLAIIKKFEERIGNAPPPPIVAQPVVAETQYAEEAVVTTEPDHHSTGARPSAQPMVEVPDHMASSSAFSDMLGGEPANSTAHFAVNTPAATFETSVIVPAPPVPTTDHEVFVPAQEAGMPEPVVAAPVQAVEEIPVSAIPVPEPPPAPVEAAPAPVAQAPAPEPVVAATSEPATDAQRHPQFIPVFKDPDPPAEPEYTFMPTAVAAESDLEIPREPALQETAEEATRSTKAEHIEPGLMSTIGQQVEAFSAGAPEAPVSAAPPVDANPVSESAPQASDTSATTTPANEPAAEVSDSDFEARVAAALSAYNKATEAETTHAASSAPVIGDHVPPLATPDAAETHAVEPPPEQAYAAAAPIPSFEYQPPVDYHPPVRAIEPAPSAGNAYEHVAPPVEIPPQPSPASLSVDSAAVAASVDAAIPEAAASVAAETGAEHHHTIAQAVHRVMERLKPELVEEIMKELRSKK
jgi:CheY-like chemotaxis protein